MPGIPALQLRGFAELDRARLMSASKAKTFPLTGQTLFEKIKLERLTRRKQKQTYDFELLSCSYYSAAKSVLQIGLTPEFYR